MLRHSSVLDIGQRNIDAVLELLGRENIPLDSPDAQASNGENPLRKRKGWGADTFVLLSTRSWAPLYGVDDLDPMDDRCTVVP